MMNFISPTNVVGMPNDEYARLLEVVNVFVEHQSKNEKKARYYEGNIRLADVNLGIALPSTMSGLEIGCAWGAKCVDVLAARSMLDGFVGQDGEAVAELDKIMQDNRLLIEYPKACRDELKLGATFATLSRDPEIGCKIRFHSAQTAAALWDGDAGRIERGIAIIDTVRDEFLTEKPTLIYYYTSSDVWALVLDGSVWHATRFPHRMGRPLMEPLVWNATSGKPFGRSRIKEPVRRLIDSYVRTIANATVGLEFATTPQKYLLGITDEQYDAVINQKFRQYVGSIIAATNNPETGEHPVFGQLPQGSITPHVDMLRLLATQFAAATGLTVSDTGVVNDANPTSFDAIMAQSQTLVSMAEQLNAGNGEALRNIALMGLAISHDMTEDELPEEQKAIMPHFRNPAMPSVAVTADAAVKIASSRQSFAKTDVFLEMLGFSPADVRRIKAQEAETADAAGVDAIGFEV